MVYELNGQARPKVNQLFITTSFMVMIAYLRNWMADIETLDNWQWIPEAADKHRLLKKTEHLLLRSYDQTNRCHIVRESEFIPSLHWFGNKQLMRFISLALLTAVLDALSATIGIWVGIYRSKMGGYFCMVCMLQLSMLIILPFLYRTI